LAPKHPYNYDQIWKTVYGDMQNLGPTHKHIRRILAGILSELDYQTALDVGCGAGQNLELLGSGHKEMRFCGIDISAVALETAKSMFPGEFIQMDIQAGCLEQCFDLVFCSLVLTVLPDDESALKHMAQMTRKYLLLTAIAGNFERYRVWEETVGNLRNYRHGELEAKVRHTGLTVVQTIYWGFPFYSPLIRTTQNYTSTGSGNFGLFARLTARLLYYLYFFNSSKRGDIVFLLAQKEPS
jgi:SAM-dependent methyltransferase